MCNKFRKAGMLGFHCIIEISIPDFIVIVVFVLVCFHCTVDAPFFDFEPGGLSPRFENAGQSIVGFFEVIETFISFCVISVFAYALKIFHAVDRWEESQCGCHSDSFAILVSDGPISCFLALALNLSEWRLAEMKKAITNINSWVVPLDGIACHNFQFHFNFERFQLQGVE